MIRSLTAALVLTSLAIPSVEAASFASARCDDPKLIAIFEDKIRNARADGSPLISHGIHTGEITKSETSFASRDKLVCAISLQVNHAGATSHLRLLYTFQQFKNGKVTATLTPR